MKTTVIRCSKKHEKKSGGDVTCRRFLAKLDEQALTLICPKCSQKYLITRKALRGFDVISLPSETLIPESQESVHGC